MKMPVMQRKFSLIPCCLSAGAFLFVTALATSAFAQAPAPAGAAPGRGGPPPPMTNLQVLPKDMARPDVIAMMRGFQGALGVQCNYCHVAEGQGGRNDFAADDKQTKKTARLMMQMVTHVNEMIAGGVGKPAADVTKVQCATCHRGEAMPKTPVYAPPPPPAPAAAPARP